MRVAGEMVVRRSVKKEFLKAVESNDIAALRRILADGADPNFLTRYGETPLFVALNRGHEDTAMALLDAGADPGVVSNNGTTPLFWAARHGYLRVVERLLQLGVDVHAARDGDVPPLAMAVSCNHAEVVRLLVAHGADFNRPYLGLHLKNIAADDAMRRALRCVTSRRGD